MRSDVYGFGVVLLEILTGLKVLDMERPSGQQNLVEWARPSLLNKTKVKKIMDPRLEDQYPSKAAIQAAEIILKCLEPDPKNRPSMEQVLQTLQQINAIKMNPKESKANGKHKTTHRHRQNTANSHHPSYGHNRSPLHHHKYGGNGGGAGSRPRSPLP